MQRNKTVCWWRRYLRPPVKGRSVSEIFFDVMSKEPLMGMEGSGKYGFRNLGVHDRSFVVSRQLNECLEWYGPDLSAFTSRFSKEEGRPVGTVYATINGAKSKRHGRTFRTTFGSNFLMRTNAFDGQNPELSNLTNNSTCWLRVPIQPDTAGVWPSNAVILRTGVSEKMFGEWLLKQT